MQSLKVPFLHDELFHLETRKREECFPLSPERPEICAQFDKAEM